MALTDQSTNAAAAPGAAAENGSPGLSERLAIVGTGAIACGLARNAGAHGEVVMYARSEASRTRAGDKVGDAAAVVTDLGDLAGATYVIEAVVEDLDAKRELYAQLGGVLGHDAVLASATSSLPITRLAEASGRPDRFAGLHPFNPVEKMKLVELAFPDAASEDTRRRTRAVCEALGKTAVDVPDIPGFVVNRLLFPFLFSAVELLEQTGLEPKAIDTCMKLGAAHPMGPLALLDFVGMDVAVAIGDSIGADVPERLRTMCGEGRLGRKAGAGFYEYGR